MDFLNDFFYTNLRNHVEFSKWTQTLDKGDDILLISLLERLTSTDPILTVSFGADEGDACIQQGEKTPLKQPHLTNLTKNPLNIANGYGMMQDLDGHSYNIYEIAYLARGTTKNWKTQYMAYVAVTVQLLFVAMLVIYNVTAKSVTINVKETGFREICVIMVVSTILLTLTVRSQFSGSKKFNKIFSAITRSRPANGRNIFLFLNFLINQVLGFIVLIFNVYFILVSNDPTDAVLNVVGLAFIVEIDDFFIPNWYKDKLEDANAQVLMDYIAEPFSFEEVVVERIAGRALLNINDDDKIYVGIDPDPKAKANAKVRLDKDHFTVTVYVANRQESEVRSVATSYDSTVYRVGGTKMKMFHSSLLKFHCLKNLRDVSAFK
mmetsp:Transcript_17841/g.35620  ORF Transcript_17841/g.35620 Transcript_17841/m.35620 type:complete len:378 (+) Transcript_17841:197-1330(+)